MKEIHIYDTRGLIFRAVGILLCIAAAGCLVSSESHESRSGTYVADETFAQIKPGQTTAAWVKATLGWPSRVTRIDNETELWDYTYTEEKQSGGRVFLLFKGDNVKESTSHAFVELKSGIVTRAWRG